MRTDMNIDLNNIEQLSSKFLIISDIQKRNYYSDNRLNFIQSILNQYDIEEINELVSLNDYINQLINDFYNRVNMILKKLGNKGKEYIKNLIKINNIYNIHNIYYFCKIDGFYNDGDDFILRMDYDNSSKEYIISLKTLQLSSDELETIISDNVKQFDFINSEEEKLRIKKKNRKLLKEKKDNREILKTILKDLELKGFKSPDDFDEKGTPDGYASVSWYLENIISALCVYEDEKKYLQLSKSMGFGHVETITLSIYDFDEIVNYLELE